MAPASATAPKSSARPRVRPLGDTIDASSAEAVRAWALWLETEEDSLLHLIDIVGSSVGQIEYVLGKKPRARW